MSEPEYVEVSVLCRVDRSDEERPRLTLCAGQEDGDPYCCVHGTKLRWNCDECNEHFQKKKCDKYADEEEDAPLQCEICSAVISSGHLCRICYENCEEYNKIADEGGNPDESA